MSEESNVESLPVPELSPEERRSLRLVRIRDVLENLSSNEVALERLATVLEGIGSSEDGETLYVDVEAAGLACMLLHLAECGLLEETLPQLPAPQMKLWVIDRERSSTPEALNHPDGPITFFDPKQELPQVSEVCIQVDMV